jgi:integrase
VNSKEWKQSKFRLKEDWYIYYRLYDPSFKDDPKYKKGKLVILKGMNHLKSLKIRQAHTEVLLMLELQKLKEKGFNPITGKFNVITSCVGIIENSTPFITALTIAAGTIQVAEITKRDIDGVIKLVHTAALQLNLSQIPIITISRKHIKVIFAQIEANLGSKSAHRYNKLRSYLMILFNELLEMEATEVNPLKMMSKKKTIKRLRTTLSPESRVKINEYLKEHHYRFWLFVHIFFHSGARITEMIVMKRKDVDIDRQVFKLTISKDSSIREVERPIKNVALSYWLLAIGGCKPDDYIFSQHLLPGPVAIKAYQITKRWNRHIKKKLGIEEDFYSLKHLNLDEISALLDLKDASAMASHRSTLITGKVYAVNEAQRQAERLKNVNNLFA